MIKDAVFKLSLILDAANCCQSNIPLGGFTKITSGTTSICLMFDEVQTPYKPIAISILNFLKMRASLYPYQYFKEKLLLAGITICSKTFSSFTLSIAFIT